MIQEAAENPRGEVITETCLQLWCGALFLTAIKYLSRKETQKAQRILPDAPSAQRGRELAAEPEPSTLGGAIINVNFLLNAKLVLHSCY